MPRASRFDFGAGSDAIAGRGDEPFEARAMDLAAHAVALVAASDWLALATTDDAGHPAASYVPFACLDGGFAIAVSGLAAHTRHLRARPDASALVVATSPSAEGSYARARLVVAIRAQSLERGSSASDALWDALERRHGEIVRTLRELPDFAALRLEPLYARIVLGFAAASDMDADTIRSIVSGAV